MIKLLIAFGVAALLWIAYGLSQFTPDLPPNELRAAICAELGSAECLEVPPPTLVISNEIVDAMGERLGIKLNGFHILGTEEVYVRRDVDEVSSIYSVYVHESVHYYLFKSQLPGGTDYCYSERRAREITAKLADKPYTDEWRKRAHC